MFNKSNVDINGSDIFDILGTPTYLLVDGKDKDMMILIDDIVHVFSEKEHYNTFNAECKKYEKCNLIKATLGMIMYDVIKQDLNGISLHGYFDNEDPMKGSFISIDDLKRNSNVIETAYYIMACAMGEETNEATLYNISNKQFYFFGHPGRETIATEKEVEGEKLTALPIFMTKSAILKAQKELGVELEIGIDTLINIEKITDDKFIGFAIDPFGTVVSFIDRESVRMEQKRHMATWTDDSVVSYLKYIANTDELFVILSPMFDPKEMVGAPLLIGGAISDFSVFLFEKKEDAEKFIDGRPEPSFGGVRPIGLINPEEQLKEFIINLLSNGVEYVFFNANSDYNLYMKLEEVYNIMFGENPSITEKEPDAMCFPLIDNFDGTTPSEKEEKLIKHIIDFSEKCGKTISSMNLAYECSAEDMLFATNYANGKIVEMLMQGREDNDVELMNMKDIHFDCCVSLINKMIDRGDVYLMCEGPDPIINEQGSCCIALSSRYIHDMPRMCPIKLSPVLIKELAGMCEYITIIDGDKLGTTISAELFNVCMQYIDKEIEPNKLKFFMHYAFNTDLSMTGIELLYQAVIANKTLFDEIIAMIDAGDKFPEKMLGLNDKTATDFYTEENGCASAYIDFVEYICGIIPDCD